MSAATWVRFYLMMTTGERVITDLRRAVFGHLLDARAGVLRADAHRRGHLAAHQRRHAAAGGDRLRRLDVPAQRAHGARRARDARRSRAASSRRWSCSACRRRWCRSCSSAAACAASRASTRTAWPTSPPTSTSRCTRSAPCRPTGTRRATAEFFGERAEAAYASGVARIGNKAFLISAVMLIALLRGRR